MQSFVKSLVSILLTVLLIVAVISQLGIETTSFAALLASAGVAVGMALSGNLQNFAGGTPDSPLPSGTKVGDYIECQGQGGTVREIQIFLYHTRHSGEQGCLSPQWAFEQRNRGELQPRRHTPRRLDRVC